MPCPRSPENSARGALTRGCLPVGRDAVVLVVHAAALLAVLDYLSDAADAAKDPAGGPAGVIARLLRHEARYWQQSQSRYGLALARRSRTGWSQPER